MKNYFHLRSKVLMTLAAQFFAVQIFAQTQLSDTNAPLKLLPPYPDLPPTFWEQHRIAIMIAGISVTVLAAFCIWLILRPKPKATILAEVQARAALATLREQREDGVVLSRISRVVRNYFGASFNLPAGELTTAEFTRALSGREEIGEEISGQTADFLRECDARKFSLANTEAPLNAADRALNLVEQAEQRRAQFHQPAETQNQIPRA